MKILVRNLDRKITRDELLKLFQPFGTIQSCDLVLDKATGLSKGFGFVEMPREQEAREAIQKLNGKKIGGTQIRVKRTLRGEPEIPYRKKGRDSHG